MTRIETLREQARVLRVLARSFEGSPTISGDLAVLAKRCDAVAENAAREVAARLVRPVQAGNVARPRGGTPASSSAA